MFPLVLSAETLYNCEVLVISVDFTDGQHVYEEIVKQLADLDIGILGIVQVCCDRCYAASHVQPNEDLLGRCRVRPVVSSLHTV